jgi:hypothetical protein
MTLDQNTVQKILRNPIPGESVEVALLKSKEHVGRFVAVTPTRLS